MTEFLGEVGELTGEILGGGSLCAVLMWFRSKIPVGFTQASLFVFTKSCLTSFMPATTLEYSLTSSVKNRYKLFMTLISVTLAENLEKSYSMAYYETW